MTTIKRYRMQLNLTQAQLAKKLGVVPSTITQWESGARKPDVVTLKKLAGIFNCTTDDLLISIEI